MIPILSHTQKKCTFTRLFPFLSGRTSNSSWWFLLSEESRNLLSFSKLFSPIPTRSSLFLPLSVVPPGSPCFSGTQLHFEEAFMGHVYGCSHQGMYQQGGFLSSSYSLVNAATPCTQCTPPLQACHSLLSWSNSTEHGITVGTQQHVAHGWGLGWGHSFLSDSDYWGWLESVIMTYKALLPHLNITIINYFNI